MCVFLLLIAGGLADGSVDEVDLEDAIALALLGGFDLDGEDKEREDRFKDVLVHETLFRKRVTGPELV